MNSATAPDSAQMPDVVELTSGPQPDPFVDALSLLASELSGIAVRIQKLERSHLGGLKNFANRSRQT